LGAHAIHGFVAQLRAKIRKMAFVARRIRQFVAPIGQNSTKMGCVRDARDESLDTTGDAFFTAFLQ
jgi:hypothetical protein